MRVPLRPLFVICYLTFLQACAQMDAGSLPVADAQAEVGPDLPPADTAPEPLPATDWVLAPSGTCTDGEWTAIKYVIDGDTFDTTDGTKVRLLGVNTPEIQHGGAAADCGGDEARVAVSQRIPPGTEVCLQKDTKAGDLDKYGRSLRYAYFRHKGWAVMLNGWIVRQGFGRVYYPFAKGLREETHLLSMQSRAEKDNLGGWAKCGW